MSSTNIYENLPLKKLNSDDSSKTRNGQNSEVKQKKRKSTPDIQKVSPQNNIPKKPKSSRSISEMFFNRNLEHADNADRESEENLTSGGEKIDAEESCKKVQSTPTSTLDDGYESCNSTPLVSGLLNLHLLRKFTFLDATLFTYCLRVRLFFAESRSMYSMPKIVGFLAL